MPPGLSLIRETPCKPGILPLPRGPGWVGAGNPPNILSLRVPVLIVLESAFAPMVTAISVYTFPEIEYPVAARIAFVRPWVPGFIEECAAFPNGAHDDQ
jgi:hypothetical protein